MSSNNSPESRFMHEAYIPLALDRLEEALRNGAVNAAMLVLAYDAGHGRRDADLLRDSRDTPLKLADRANEQVARLGSYVSGDEFRDVVSATVGRLLGFVVETQPEGEVPHVEPEPSPTQPQDIGAGGGGQIE